MKRSGWKTYVIMLGLIAAVSAPFILHPILRTVEPQVVHYSMDFGGLDGAEQDMALEAASIAFALWEKDNPGLIFQEGDGGDVEGMTIIFVDWWPKDGFAMCPPWENSENHCHVIISSNIVRASTDIEYNKMSTTYVLAHEIGHVLGFMHTSTSKHLMYGSDDGWAFDWTYEREQTFVIPDPRSLYD